LLIAQPFGYIFLQTSNKAVAEKFSSAAAECLLYSVFFVIGAVVVPIQPFFWPSKYWWIEQPDGRLLTGSATFYYILYAARYIQSAITTLIEPRKKDFLEMMLHHIVTVILVVLSFWYGYVNVGCIVMFLLDAADPFLHLAKIFVYKRDSYQLGKIQRTEGTDSFKRAKFLSFVYGVIADIIFGIFAVVFLVTRNILYPYICWSAVFEGSKYMLGENISMIETARLLGPPYWACVLLLVVIMVLQIIWLRMILIGIYKVIVKGEASSDDRSDSEPDTSKKGSGIDETDESPRNGKKKTN